MKNFIFLVLLSAFTYQSKGQNDGKNMGKINVSAFVLKGINVQYERQVGNRFTVALGYSAIPKSDLAFQNTIKSMAGDADINFGNFRLGTSIFTPELRYYVGKRGAFHGFYLAPYIRIGTYNIDGPVTIFPTTNPRTIVFTGKLNSYTGGLMIGSQFKLSEKLFLDWWIVGGSFGGANGNLVATTQLSAFEQQELRRELERIKVPLTTIEYDVNNNGASINTTGGMAGLRGLGLNLGIRF